MKNITLILTFLLPVTLFGQLTVDTTISLDLLKAPASPAFTILGIAASDIERPTDLNSFTVTLRDATNNFTALPKSYAIQVAPFLLSNKKFTLDKFDDNRYTFRQSLLLSIGFTHQGPKGQEDIDSLKTSKLGIGLKFSIIRPKWSTATRNAYKRLIAAQALLLDDYRAFETQNDSLAMKREELKALNAKPDMTPEDRQRRGVLAREINLLMESLNDSINNNLSTSSPSYELAKKAAGEIKNERKGFFLDFSSGFALDFPDNRFNNSKLYRGGAWLTGGNENGNTGFTSLFILRYLYNPKTVFAAPANPFKTGNISTMDGGARFLYSSAKGKFAFSSEALYRSILNESDVHPSWRLVLNAEYDIGKNQKLTFSFGKDFDGTISKGGNLVSAINLIFGFGSERASPKQ